jgi:23S rRNA pseudouridine1911/1915/1917 synthase
MTTTDSGKEAVTHWQLESQLNGAALLRLKLETGRTHQIRVHLESVGAAIIGDPQYKGNYSPSNKKVIAAIKHFNRQALHATKLSFIHPISNERVTFESPIPDDMKKLMEVFL